MQAFFFTFAKLKTNLKNAVTPTYIGNGNKKEAGTYSFNWH